MKPIPEFMIRVKLPSSGGYHSSPSGDTEYEEAYHKAISEALPDGFEVWPTRLNQKRPQDSEGKTWMLIRCTDPNNAMAKLLDDATRLRAALEKARELANQITKIAP